MMARDKQKQAGAGPGGWRAYRQELGFLTLFVLLLAGGFTAISLNAINDNVIVPFTGGIAQVSALVLNLLGQQVTLTGSRLIGPRFGVEILNGCNGVEAMIIFVSAVLAFPAPWKARLLGLGFGVVAIQALNLVRVVALFLTGTYLPSLFDSSHTVVWQTIVILFGVLLWILWASRFAGPRRPPEAAEAAGG